MSENPAKVVNNCVRCNAALDRRTALRLWDGRWYCRRCVEGHSQLVARHVDTRDVLDDTLTFQQGSMFWQYLTIWGIAFVSMVVILMILLLTGFLSLVDLLVVAGVLLAMPFVYSVGNLATLPQTIRIADGRVEIVTPLLSRCVPFTDCEWDVDGRLEDRAWRPVSRWLSLTPAIELRVRNFGSRNIFFACVSDETRALWRDFLTLANPRCAAADSVVNSEALR